MINSLQEWLFVAFRWTVETSLLAAFLIAIVLCARLLARKALPAHWVYAMWLIVVLRLALPVLPESHWSIYNVVMPNDAGGATSSRGMIEQSLPPMQTQSPVLPSAVERGVASIAEPPSVDSAVPVAERQTLEPVPNTAAKSAKAEFSIARALPYVWLAGVVLVGLVITVRSVLASKRLSAGKTMTDAAWIDALRLAKIKVGVRRAVRLIETESVYSPALYGVFRLRILIPSHLVDQLTAEERRFVLLHELAHAKRQDIAINWLVAVLQALHWFNPLVWVAFIVMRHDRETACDAHVLNRLRVSERLVYGQTLLNLLGSGRVLPLVGVVGILESRSNLRHRVRAIASYKRPGGLRHAASFAVLLLLAVTTLTNATPATLQEAARSIATVEIAESDWVAAVAANSEEHNYVAEYALVQDIGPKILPSTFGLPERMQLKDVAPANFTTYARARVEVRDGEGGAPRLLEYAVGDTHEGVTFCGVVPRPNDAPPLAMFLDSSSAGVVASDIETTLAEPITWSTDGGNSVTVLNEFARESGLRIVLDALDGVSIRTNGDQHASWGPGADQVPELSFVDMPAREVFDALLKHARLAGHVSGSTVFAAPSAYWHLDLRDGVQRRRFDDPFWVPIVTDGTNVKLPVQAATLERYPSDPLGDPHTKKSRDGHYASGTSGKDRPIHRDLHVRDVRIEWPDLLIESDIARSRESVWMFDGNVRVTYRMGNKDEAGFQISRLRIDVDSDSVRSIIAMIAHVVDDDADLLAAVEEQSKIAHRAEREQLRQIREQWNPVSYAPRVTENALGEPVDVSFGSSALNQVVGRADGDVLSMIYSGGVRVEWDGLRVEAMQAARENEFWKFRGPVQLSFAEAGGVTREHVVDFLELDSKGESASSVWNRLTADPAPVVATVPSSVELSAETVEANKETISSVAYVPVVSTHRIVDEKSVAAIGENSEVVEAERSEFTLNAEVDVAPAERIELAAAPGADAVTEPKPAVRHLGEKPFGSFKELPGQKCDALILLHKELGHMRFEIYRDGVVARFEDATVFADQAVRVGDCFRFEGNVRVPEAWGASYSEDVLEFGPALPIGLSLSGMNTLGGETFVRETRPPLAQRQQDIAAGDRKGSRVSRERPPTEFNPALEQAGEARSLQERLDFGIVGYVSGDTLPIAFLESVETSLRAPLYDVVDGELTPIRKSRRIQGLASINVEQHNVNFTEYLRGVLRPYNLTFGVFDDFVAIGTEAELQALRNIEDV